MCLFTEMYHEVTEDGRTNNNQTMNVIHCVTGARSGRAETKKTRTKTNCKQRITDFLWVVTPTDIRPVN